MRPLFPVFSGVLLWLSFPPASLFPLAWIALIPFLAFLVKRRSVWSLLVGHLGFSFIFFGGVLYWIPRVLVVYGGLTWLVALPVFGLMLSLMSVFLFPFSLFTQLASRRDLRLGVLCAPGFWLLTELLRNYAMVNGFPWASLGYSQFGYSWIIQISDIGGVYFLSFLLVLVNCSFFATFRLRDSRYTWTAVILFALANLYGAYRVHLWEPAASYRVTAGLVQGNLKLGEDREYYAKMYFEELPRLAKRAGDQGAQWILLPEAENPYLFDQDFYFKSFWKGQAVRLGAYILFNSATIDPDRKGVYYNSAYQLEPKGRASYRYDKIHLVPFGEYLPFGDWLTFAEPLVREVSAFHPGSELNLGTVEEIRFATLICYEAIFPEISRAGVLKGAEILVNLTNDAWFGVTAAPEQHLHMAAFRAIENRKTLLRAANSGYTAVILPTGEVRERTSLFHPDVVVAEIEANRSETPFSFFGDGLNAAIIIVTFATWLIPRQRRERSLGG